LFEVIPYKTGITDIVGNIALTIILPLITAANGRWVSEPSPVAKHIGIGPNTVIEIFINTGRNLDISYYLLLLRINIIFYTSQLAFKLLKASRFTSLFLVQLIDI